VEQVQDAVLNWMDAFPVLESNAAAAEAGARLLLTEDLHAGFSWRAVCLVNPLIEPAHPCWSSCWVESHLRLEPEVEAEAAVDRLQLRG